METIKKQDYINQYGKSYLAQALIANNWADDADITVIGGLNAPHNKNSNLYKALQISTTNEYVLGGHRRTYTEGWWIAVRM